MAVRIILLNAWAANTNLLSCESPAILLSYLPIRSPVRSSCVVTDLAEVFRLGTAKVEENLSFRRYLSAHHYIDRPFLILASQVQQHVDCTACANCCRHSVVSVNKSEIENIAGHIGTTSEAVARLYTIPDPDAPALRILRNSGEACVFLDGNLCMIYDARPQTCRDFPHVAVGKHSL